MEWYGISKEAIAKIPYSVSFWRWHEEEEAVSPRAFAFSQYRNNDLYTLFCDASGGDNVIKDSRLLFAPEFLGKANIRSIKLSEFGKVSLNHHFVIVAYGKGDDLEGCFAMFTKSDSIIFSCGEKGITMSFRQDVIDKITGEFERTGRC